MFALTRLILIDSYKTNAIQELRLNGVNGAGKTTLLRLLPLFFGERPSRLVKKNRVTESFANSFLQKNPDYSLQDWSEHDNIPSHWNQIQPLSFTAYADTHDIQLESELNAIVQKLKTEAITSSKSKQRTVNVITQQVGQQKLELPLYRKHTQTYFAKVQNTAQAVSALMFQQEFAINIEPRLWLACILHDYFRRQHRQGLQIEFVELPEDNIFTGNKKVQDILIGTQVS